MYRILTVALLLSSQPAIGSSLLVDDDFTSYTAAGLSPGGTGGALDSHLWAVTGASDADTTFDASHPGGDFARGPSTGGVRTGGLYAFLLPGGEPGLGVQATSSDFTPGSVIRRVVNSSGETLSNLAVALDLWFLNNGPRGSRMILDFSTSRGQEWIAIPGAETTTPAAVDALGWQAAPLQAMLPLAGLEANQMLLLRWRFDDGAGTGTRDEVALSGLRLHGDVPLGTAPPRRLPAPPIGAPLALLLALLAAGHRGRAAARRHPSPRESPRWTAGGPLCGN